MFFLLAFKAGSCCASVISVYLSGSLYIFKTNVLAFSKNNAIPKNVNVLFCNGCDCLM